MGMAERIEGSLQRALQPIHVELTNESYKHSVPPGSETHWNLIVVSAAFEGQRLLARQRAVYGALFAELQGGVHALTMKTLTPAEWAAQGGAVDNSSPPCLGGGA